MTDPDLRKHARKFEKAIINFGFLNQTTRHLGFVENTSEYGIYFVTDKALAVGALVAIQPWRCGMTPPETSSPASREHAAAACAQTHNANHRLNAMVIGKVVHCRRLGENTPPVFGVGAHYQSPSV